MSGFAGACGWVLAAHVIGVGLSYLGLLAIGIWLKVGVTGTWDRSMSERFSLLWMLLLVAPLALGSIVAIPSVWRLTRPPGGEGLLTARRLSRIGLLALPIIVAGSWLLAQPEALSRLWGATVPISIERTMTVMTLAAALLLLAVVSHVGNLLHRLKPDEPLGLVQFEYWLVLIACFVNLLKGELIYKIWLLRIVEAIAIIIGVVLLLRLRRALREHLDAFVNRASDSREA